MKKSKKILIVSLILITVLAASVTAYAFTGSQIAYEAGEDTWEEFRVEMLEIKKALLKERVEEGILTQEEADEILENIELRQENCIEAGGCKPGNGFGIMRNTLGIGNGFGAGNGFRAGNEGGTNRGMGFGVGGHGRGSW